MDPKKIRWLCVLGLWFVAGCSEKEPPPPERTEVLALLQQEAAVEKQKGEADINPALGVSIRYDILDVDVREQPGNAAEPWAGTIRLRIESETPDLDGTSTETFERSYDYVWSTTENRWAMR